MKKVYIVGPGLAEARMFQSLGFTMTNEVHEANLMCFTGGEDVTPALYLQPVHKKTYNNNFRDAQEQWFFKRAQELGIPCVGICRGGQFLNVMSGGSMYQDVDKHALSAGHEIIDKETGETILVTSTHHQMMKPSGDAVLVAYSNLGGYREWYEGEVMKRDVSDCDVEVVYYPHTNVLCFQPHPEYTGEKWNNMTRYFNDLLNRFFSFEEAKCGCC